MPFAQLRNGFMCDQFICFPECTSSLLQILSSLWMRCQVDVYLIHLCFVLDHNLCCIFWALWVTKVPGKVTQHLWKVIPNWAVAVGPSVLIFPWRNVVSHLRDKHYDNLKFLTYSVFRKHQVVERIRREVVNQV